MENSRMKAKYTKNPSWRIMNAKVRCVNQIKSKFHKSIYAYMVTEILFPNFSYNNIFPTKFGIYHFVVEQHFISHFCSAPRRLSYSTK